MPLYEFKCDACEEEFEELVASLKRVDEVKCPACSGSKVQRLQSGFAVGSGGGLGASLGSSGGCSSSGPFT